MLYSQHSAFALPSYQISSQQTKIMRHWLMIILITNFIPFLFRFQVRGCCLRLYRLFYFLYCLFVMADSWKLKDFFSSPLHSPLLLVPLRLIIPGVPSFQNREVPIKERQRGNKFVRFSIASLPTGLLIPPRKWCLKQHWIAKSEWNSIKCGVFID